MKFKGTKGPWKISDRTDNPKTLWITTGNGESFYGIAIVLPINYKANAQLISKAPEMLEMLKDILEGREDGRTYVTNDEIKNIIKEAITI